MANPLDRGFNVAVNHIASRLFPTGYDVGPDAPFSLNDLTKHIAKTGRMLVSNEYSENTIFDDPETNYAFRAWHDFHHWKLQAPFTLDGERQVANAMIKDIRKLYGTVPRWEKLIKAEVIGQTLYKIASGEFPRDQRRFVEMLLAG